MTIKDQVNGDGTDSINDNIVQVPIIVIVSDENDNAPEFKNVPYETDVLEDAAVGTTVFAGILVTDRDTVGETLNVSCSVAQPLGAVGEHGDEMAAAAHADKPNGCEKWVRIIAGLAPACTISKCVVCVCFQVFHRGYREQSG